MCAKKKKTERRKSEKYHHQPKKKKNHPFGYRFFSPWPGERSEERIGIFWFVVFTIGRAWWRHVWGISSLALHSLDMLPRLGRAPSSPAEGDEDKLDLSPLSQTFAGTGSRVTDNPALVNSGLWAVL